MNHDPAPRLNPRPLQRQIWETSLEQKCRIWFGISLLVLVIGAFWWVDTIAEDIVRKSTREKGRDFVDSTLLKIHWDAWETDPEAKPLLKEVMRDLQSQPYSHKILSLEDEPVMPAAVPGVDPKPRRVFLPENEAERERLQRLRTKWAKELAALKEADAAPANPAVPPVSTRESSTESPDIFDEARVPGKEQEEYHYYKPVFWKASCNRCHRGFLGGDGLDAGAAGAIGLQNPFRVVKVVMPYGETRASINLTRAILITTAIVTVVLAILALYVVVKYVVVKPLQHLHHISDEISRGNTDLRADLQTNDEFEDLGEAFNRMLRHMVEAQEQLRGANKELDANLGELARANMQLNEANRLKSEFLANMSHELRTPLNSILGFSDVLRGIDSLNTKQKRYVENIQTSGRQLLEMIDDVLDLAKLEAGKMQVRPVEFPIEVVIQSQCDMVRTLSEEKNIDLVCEVQPGLPHLFQDQNKVLQILTNLLSNAIKFTPEGGRVVVTAKRDAEGWLEMTVTDTGIGIAEEDRGIIFEKFRQGRQEREDNLTREYSGTGLGLSICKELCILLGGEIGFMSELGKGSTFTVRLPWEYVAPKPSKAALQTLHAKADEIIRTATPSGVIYGDGN